MYPEQPKQPQYQPPQLSPNPVPMDYLDQIAAPQKQRGMNPKLFWGIIIGGILLAIAALVLMLAGGGSSGKQISTERLGLRLEHLQKTSKDAQKNINSTELRALNSRLTTQLTNINRDIAAPLAAADIKLKNADKKTVAEEKKNAETLASKLEDARLNDTFDRNYAREMSYQMETSAILMQTLYKSSKSKSLKEFLTTSYDDFSALQKEFAAYSAKSS